MNPNMPALPADDLVLRGRGPKPESIELLLYWQSIRKRKWWILAIAAVFAVLAAVAVSFVKPVYRATVTLMIEQNKAKLVSIEDVYSGVSPNREHYQTQAEMLKSPALAVKVIEKLQLAKNPEFDPRQRQSSLAGTFGLASEANPMASARDEDVQAAVLAEFLRRVSIEPVRLTQLVKLNFDATDKVLAARIANTIADLYIENDIAMRSQITQRAGDWLADRMQVLKQNLEDSERELQRYREQQGLLDTKGLAQSGASRQIEELSRALNEASQRRAEAESNFRQMQAADGNLRSAPAVLRLPFIDRLKEAEAQAERNHAALAERYGPEHPRMIQSEKEVKQARENTRQAMQEALASFSKEYDASVADERAMERSLAAAKSFVREINRKEFQLEALEQDVTTNREIYQKFLNRYRETRAASDTQNNVVARIVDPAVSPDNPYKPRKRQIISFGFILGILLGSIGALLRERVDSTVKSGDEVEEKLALPTVAVLPRLGNGDNGPGRHYLDQPKSVFSEAIRTARTSILLSAVDAQRKVLLITSSLPSEGKSAFAINLALAHAQTKKTLLIEADLRRPSLISQLGLDRSKPGLTDLLAGSATFAECIQRVDGSSLYVLPSGPSPENALEVLSSERFKGMLTRIAAACEIVIVDSPPVHLVSDAVVLSGFATGVLFVVKAESTPYPLARRCIRTLQDAGAEVIGVALNQLDFTKADRYYGAYTGYAKEYGAYESRPAQAT